MTRVHFSSRLLAIVAALLLCGCDAGTSDREATADAPAAADVSESADLLLVNAASTPSSWPDPDREGRPAESAPVEDGAVACRCRSAGHSERTDRRGRQHCGRSEASFRVPPLGFSTCDGATVIPGLVESHGHYPELGEQAERVDVSDATTTAEMAALVAERKQDDCPGRVDSGWRLG